MIWARRDIRCSVFPFLVHDRSASRSDSFSSMVVALMESRIQYYAHLRKQVLGPHRFFSENESVNKLVKDVLNNNLMTVERKSEIFFRNRFLLYPLDIWNLVTSIPKEELVKCLCDYFFARIRGIVSSGPDDSFESWVTRRFGRKMYQMFFGVYTEKLLGLPAAQIASDWARQRIIVPSCRDALVNSLLKPEKCGRTYASKFAYPRHGGIGTIANNFKEMVLEKDGTFLFDVKVERIRVNTDTRTLQAVVYDHAWKTHEEALNYLMSTIPITTFLQLIDDSNNKVHMDNNIRFRSLVLLYLILDRDKLSDNHWIYLPEEIFFSNRLSEFKNFSQCSSMGAKTLVCAEITCDYNDDTWNMSEEVIIAKVLGDLEMLKIGSITRATVLDCFCHKVKEAYPIYDLHYLDSVRTLSKYLSSFPNLSFFGRNAEFRYGNMDDSIAMGLRAAEAFLGK